MIYKTFNIINQKILILIFVSCLIIALFSIYISHNNQIIFERIDEFNDIETKAINNYTNKYNITIKYPSTKNKTVNKEITNLLNSYVKATEEDTKYFIPINDEDIFNLNINYESKRINKEIVSFIFLIKFSNKDINSININTVSYNLKDGKEITLNSFFNENSKYTQILCDMSKEHLLNNNDDIENKVIQFFIDDISYIGSNSFDGYSFSPNHLSLYLNTNKISHDYNLIYEVKIPWKNVSHLLKDNIYLLR